MVLGAGAWERETSPPAYELLPSAIDTVKARRGEDRLITLPQTAFCLRQIEFVDGKLVVAKNGSWNHGPGCGLHSPLRNNLTKRSGNFTNFHKESLDRGRAHQIKARRPYHQESRIRTSPEMIMVPGQAGLPPSPFPLPLTCPR